MEKFDSGRRSANAKIAFYKKWRSNNMHKPCNFLTLSITETETETETKTKTETETNTYTK